MVGCCPRAAIGQAAAPPNSATNSRRLMPDMGAPSQVPPPIIAARNRWAQAVCRVMSLPVTGQPVLGADLKRSELGRLPGPGGRGTRGGRRGGGGLEEFESRER